MSLPGARQLFRVLGGAPTPPLPYDARVSYVKTDGVGSFINTGVPVDAATSVSVRFASVSVPDVTSSGSYVNTIFGASYGGNTRNSRFLLSVASSSFRTYQPTITSTASDPSPVLPTYDTSVHDVFISIPEFTVKFDQTSYSTSSVGSLVQDNVLCLGSRGVTELSSNPETGYTESKFYSCQIYKAGALVFDGVPVRKDGAGYIYDRISGRMCGNAGAAGTTVAYGDDLPYDARVLYVETDGVGSYVDTGIVPVLVGDSESSVHVEFSLPRDPSTTLNTAMFAARYNAANYIACSFCCSVIVSSSVNRIQFLRPTMTSTSPLAPVDYGIHSVDLDRASIVVDGVKYSPAGSVAAGQNPIASFCLGASVIPSDASAISSFGAVRFYGCKIVTGGKTVFDGIPVRKGNAAYIYDRISGRLCGNAGASGTGVTCGPDVPFDERVEYLQSTGTQYVDTGVVATAGIGFEAIGRVPPAISAGTFPVLAGWMDGDWSEYDALYSSDAGTADIECRNACDVSLSVGENTFKAVVPKGTGAGGVARLYLLESGTSSTDTMVAGTEASSNGVHLSAFGAVTSDGPAELTPAGGRLYRYVISDPSGVLRDFSAVRVGGAGYLYDRANPTGGPLGNGLYPNIGAGGFALGADV